MPTFGKGSKVTFAGEVGADYFGLIGVVVKVHRSGGHNVYDIQITGNLIPNVTGMKFTVGGTIKNVPAGWLELFR